MGQDEVLTTDQIYGGFELGSEELQSNCVYRQINGVGRRAMIRKRISFKSFCVSILLISSRIF